MAQQLQSSKCLTKDFGLYSAATGTTRLLGKGEAVKAVFQKQNLGNNSHHPCHAVVTIDNIRGSQTLPGAFLNLRLTMKEGLWEDLFEGRGRACALRWDAEERCLERKQGGENTVTRHLWSYGYRGLRGVKRPWPGGQDGNHMQV